MARKLRPGIKLSGGVRKMRESLVQGARGRKALWAVVTWGDLGSSTPGNTDGSGGDRASGLGQGHWVDTEDVGKGTLWAL